MKKQIVVLTGSPRRNGNSDLMADAFIERLNAKHEVVKFEAGKKKISGCIACNTCFRKGVACSLMDDFNQLAPLLDSADMLVFCTPLYWFTFPAQIKAAIDKLYSFNIGSKPLKIKESMLLVCAETDDMKDFDGIKRTYELILNYKKWEDRGQLFIPNVNKIGDIKNTDGLNKARDLAMSI